MLGPILVILGIVGIVVAINYYAKLLKVMDDVEADHFPRELDHVHERRVARVTSKMNIALLIGLLAFISFISGLAIWL